MNDQSFGTVTAAAGLKRHATRTKGPAMAEAQTTSRLGTRASIGDVVHFLRMYFRNQRRQRRWARAFEESVRTERWTIPSAAVVQLIPTEYCNLRCPMCNQWGEQGYFLAGARKPEHMPEDSLIRLMRGFSPVDSLISVHGGEPFAYRHIPTLLALLQDRQFDVMFTTNGTLLGRYAEQLASIRNLGLLLSIDGDEETHDRIRGKDMFRQSVQGLSDVQEARRRRGMPLAMVAMNAVVCEWNTEAMRGILKVAKEIGAFVLNYNMRWFLPAAAGEAYDRHLQNHFGLSSSGAWRGWVSTPDRQLYARACTDLRMIVEEHRLQFRPPFVMTTPTGLVGADFEKYFGEYREVFGHETCFMPFYWARIHANGDLIFCPGHPDIVAGNVFREGFEAAFNSPLSRQFRQHIVNRRMPICNRCCGLYMTFPARGKERRVRRRLGLAKTAATDDGF